MPVGLRLSDVVDIELKKSSAQSESDDTLRIVTSFFPVELLVDDQRKLVELIDKLSKLKARPVIKPKEKVELPKFYKDEEVK